MNQVYIMQFSGSKHLFKTNLLSLSLLKQQINMKTIWIIYWFLNRINFDIFFLIRFLTVQQCVRAKWFIRVFAYKVTMFFKTINLWFFTLLWFKANKYCIADFVTFISIAVLPTHSLFIFLEMILIGLRYEHTLRIYESDL